MEQYLYTKNPWWENKPYDKGVARKDYVIKLLQSFDQKLIQILTGLRRVGKSTIAIQLVSEIINSKGVDPRKVLFFSIEEPSLVKFTIAEIIDKFRALFGHELEEKIYVFIDEIQFRDDWEKEIKSLYDTQNIKFILAGSSALLLSEKVSFLTGRYLKLHVHPLNFSEFLIFKNYTLDSSTKEKNAYYLNEYLQVGGMPEFVVNNPDRYLQTTVESILFMDLVSKFQMRNPKVLLDLIYLLADRVSATTSSPKLSNILEINKDTVLMYLNYLTKVFVVNELNNYSTSRNKQIYNPNKFYFEDNGIAHIYASKANAGALLENAVFNHLNIFAQNSDRTQLGYWYDEGREVDFVLDRNGVKYAYECKLIGDMSEIDTKSIEELIKQENLEEMYVITRTYADTVKIGDRDVIFVPGYEFLKRPFDLSDSANPH